MDSPPNEAALIASAKQGNREAVSVLYEHYAQAIYRYVHYRVESQHIAEDITAEVFLRMVRELPSFEDRGLPFGAWLYKIASNLLNDYYRQRKAKPMVELDEEMRNDDTDPFLQIENMQERQRLMDALQTLPTDYQDVLILRFMRGLSHAEVAHILNKSENALRTIQHRALKALGKKLDNTPKQRSYLRGTHHDDE